ncbi:hypothetical protein [Photorhabdus temperata]|uniref:Uncharacterized protein n=1 Tax=Photorhabdus temperata J3 TaxID=1389415 RepID=U7QUB4_PHOTE|nr:hypothetical protein [Photorhabdus temperata]EQB98809.1 hypothetical protein B738_22485 [Photorhabdus temperata subsp. temperata M1021]ERT10695.1 hypothetical protein O185_23480 [Photorhabdus temperata J3]
MPNKKHSETAKHSENSVKRSSIQTAHDESNIGSTSLGMGLDLNHMRGNSAVSSDQINEYTFWKENISEYYKWMVVVKGHLKQLDWTLKSMDSPESAGSNMAKNIETTALQTLFSHSQ